MATLDTINSMSLTTNGSPHAVHQGNASNPATTPLQTTVSGAVHSVDINAMANDSEITLWDEDDDTPANWDHLWIKVDQGAGDNTVVLQIIGQTTNVTIPLYANKPFTWDGDQLLAAANTTAISAQPTLEDIDSIVLGNYSGTTLNGVFKVID